MENAKAKHLPLFLFVPALALIGLRPFLADFVYPSAELCYQAGVIFLALVSFFAVKKPSRMDFLASSLLTLLAAYALSTAFAENLENAFLEGFRFLSYLCIFLLVLRMDNGQKLLTIKTIVLTAALISLYSLYQYFVTYPWMVERLKESNSDILNTSSYVRDILIGRRDVGTYPSPNMLGGYLLMPLFLSLYLIKDAGVNKRWFLAPSVIVMALILTKSLGAWLSLAACLLTLPFLLHPSFRKRKKVMIMTALATGAVLLLMVSARGEHVTDLKDRQNPATQRLNYWMTATRLIEKHPVVGVGSGNFQEAAVKYKAQPQTSDPRFAHNLFLNYFAETGVLGFIGAILLIVAFIETCERTSPYFFLAGLSFVFHNLVDFTYFISQVGLFWWVILGLAGPSNPGSGNRQEIGTAPLFYKI